MEWIKAVIETNSLGTEPVFGCLLDAGINGAQIIDPAEMGRFLSENPFSWDYVDESLLTLETDKAYIEFYVTKDANGRNMLEQISSRLSVLSGETGNLYGRLHLIWETVNDESWLHAWKKHYKPFRIGRNIMVVPFWEKYDPLPEDIVFTIDPGSVFGTGQHQTTQLCLEMLEDYVKPGDAVLDIGCGSGILSIVSLLLGAGFAFGLDFDPAAVISSLENMEKNGLDPSRLIVRIGDIFKENIRKEILKYRFDIAAANIVADVVISLSPMVRDFIKPEGLFIASGIITERLEDLRDVLVRHNWKILKTVQRDGWYCLVCCNHA